MCARVRAEVEAEMLLKQMEGLDNEVQSKTTTNIERAVPAIHTCWKLPIFFWESILVGNEINSVICIPTFLRYSVQLYCKFHFCQFHMFRMLAKLLMRSPEVL